jgi:hypothetical protein
MALRLLKKGEGRGRRARRSEKDRKVKRKKKPRNRMENRAARMEQGIKKERKIAKMHARNIGQE